MSVRIAVDLGGTKLAAALFSPQGLMSNPQTRLLENRKGNEVGALIQEVVREYIRIAAYNLQPVEAIGVSVPGIYRVDQGTVWAPNIPGWDHFPLRETLQQCSGSIPIIIDNDRACSILGERWQGNARDTRHAIFLAIGTGIGAGIYMNGTIIRGAHLTAGSIGWMGFYPEGEAAAGNYGDLENYASGNGIARAIQQLIRQSTTYQGILLQKKTTALTAYDVFDAYAQQDPLAVEVMETTIKYWGLAVANLISLFDPEKILLGGGVFGPAVKWIPQIRESARNWAQPVSFPSVQIEAAALGAQAALFGAAFLCNLKNDAEMTTHG